MEFSPSLQWLCCRNGESQHSVQDAVKMRMELTKLYDTVELLR